MKLIYINNPEKRKQEEIELDENYFNIAKERIEKTLKEKQNEQN